MALGVNLRSPNALLGLWVSESLNDSLRKILERRGAFSTDEAILQVLYLGMQRIAKKWTVAISDWKRALNQFAILLGDRVPTND